MMQERALNVWVVDDDQSVRWVLEKALRQADMEARSFERAEHLLDAIEQGEPDVLITDVRMPGMSGITLLERLRARSPELPIIVITADEDPETRRQARAMKAVAFFRNHVDGTALLVAIAWAIRYTSPSSNHVG